MKEIGAQRLLQVMIDYFEAGNKETDGAAKAILAYDFENRDYWQKEMDRLRERSEWTGVRSAEAEIMAGILKEIKKKLNRILPVLIAFLFLLAAHDARAGSGWTSYGLVNELTPTTKGRFIVAIDVASNPSSCKEKQGFYRDYSGTDEDHIYRLLLSALLSGKKVRVYVTDICDVLGNSEISSASIVRSSGDSGDGYGGYSAISVHQDHSPPR